MSARVTVSVVVLLGILAGCGEGSDAASSSSSYAAPALEPAELEALRRLAPADAALIVGLPSIEAADAWLTDLGAFFGETPKSILEPLGALAGGPLLRRHVVTDKPIWIALSPLDPAGSPAPVLLLPTTDAETLRSILFGSTLHADGGYVGISADPNYAPGNALAPISEPLPLGPLALRADPARLFALMRPMVEGMLPLLMASAPPASLGGMDPKAFFDLYVRVVFDSIEAIETAEGSVTLDGDELLVDGRLEVVAGSAFADIPAARCGDLDDMVSWLDGEASAQTVMAIDAGAFATANRNLLLDLADVYPGSGGDAALELVATTQVLAARCGHVFVSDGDFGPGGMEFGMMVEAPGGDDLVGTLSDLTRHGMELYSGIEVEVEKRTIDGRPATELRVDLSAFLENLVTGDSGADAARGEMMRGLYGGDGVMRYLTTARDGRVLMTGGARVDSAEARLSREPSPPPRELLAALERVEDMHTRLILRVDYGRFMALMAKSMAMSMRSAPGMPDLAEVFANEHEIPVTFWAGGKEREWTLGMTLGMTGVVGLVRDLRER